MKDEWCLPFAPVPIINIPEFGDLSAVHLVECSLALVIDSRKDPKSMLGTPANFGN